MITKGHFNFFKVTGCGFYKHGDASPHSCGIKETFRLISAWVQGRPLADTIPWDPKHTRTGAPKCYCHDMYEDEETGDFLLVLWKSETDSVGTLWGASETAATGKGKVVEYTNKYRGEKVIWGRPCYYWIVPEHETVISIKFDHSVCDSQMLQDWVTRCINNRVKHEMKTRQTTEKGFVRYSFGDGAEGGESRYAYRFDVKLRSMDTASAEMRELASRVTHIVRRETIQLAQGTDDRAAWIKAFDKIPYLNPKPKAKQRQIEVRAEAKPTPAEMEKIIEEFARENRKSSDWDNIGFDTDKGTVWVDKYRLHVEAHVNQEKPGIFPAAALYEQLTGPGKRDRLLLPLTRQPKKKSQTKAKTGT